MLSRQSTVEWELPPELRGLIAIHEEEDNGKNLNDGKVFLKLWVFVRSLHTAASKKKPVSVIN